jgi:glycerol-1-phosphate dehydrogenase [NAD(P)+]
VPQSAAKYIDADHLRQRLATVREHWSKLRERLIGQLMPAAALRDLLLTADCPATPEEIGLDHAGLRASYAQARQIRSRYTIFDLAAETGVFAQCVENLFTSGGFWSSS